MIGAMVFNITWMSVNLIDAGGLMPAITIAAEELQANCMKLLDEVASSGQPLVITKQGKAVAKLVPMPPKPVLFGAMAHSACYKGDIFSAIEDRWDACD
jgi:prevent-host-death family protein